MPCTEVKTRFNTGCWVKAVGESTSTISTLPIIVTVHRGQACHLVQGLLRISLLNQVLLTYQLERALIVLHETVAILKF